MSPKYLKTGDLAMLCDVDTKTIRDWTNRRGMPHMRTPGKQRRFKPHDVVPWLRRNGYTVPRRLLMAARASAAEAAEAAEAEAQSEGT